MCGCHGPLLSAILLVIGGVGVAHTSPPGAVCEESTTMLQTAVHNHGDMVARKPEEAYDGTHQPILARREAFQKENVKMPSSWAKMPSSWAKMPHELAMRGQTTDPELMPLEQNQLGHATFHNRYPEIFAKARDMFETSTNPKILSFGCSYGKEVRTLREYLPLSTVHGIDIDKQIIADNNKANKDEQVSYFSDPGDLQFESYDAVFAMSVLTHSPDPPLAFDTFNHTIALIDQLVSKGGYLAVFNSNYRFTDTVTSKSYDNIGAHDKTYEFQSGDTVPLYDKDVDVLQICEESGRCQHNKTLQSQLSNETRKNYPYVFFKKTEDR